MVVKTYTQKLLLIIIVLFLGIGCGLNKSVYKIKTNEPLSFNEKEFNGFYSCKTDSLKGKENLAKILYDSYSFKKSNYSLDSINNVFLSSVDNNKLKVSLYENDSLVASFQLKTKMHNELLSVKSNLRLIPFPFILFRLRWRKLYLGNDSSNRLVVKQGLEEFLWVFIMAGGYNAFTKTEFEPYN